MTKKTHQNSRESKTGIKDSLIQPKKKSHIQDTDDKQKKTSQIKKWKIFSFTFEMC